MDIRMDVLCLRMPYALDLIEYELLGASEHHSKHVAVLCRSLGFSEKKQRSLSRRNSDERR